MHMRMHVAAVGTESERETAAHGNDGMHAMASYKHLYMFPLCALYKPGTVATHAHKLLPSTPMRT